MENNQLMNPEGKQDCELNAFRRLAEKLKSYFSRLKVIFLMDALYATQDVMGILHKNRWDYIIQFSKNKLKHFAKLLHKKKKTKLMITSQLYYRGRRQEFYWHNHLIYGYGWELDINLVACLECYEKVNPLTGDIEVKY